MWVRVRLCSYAAAGVNALSHLFLLTHCRQCVKWRSLAPGFIHRSARQRERTISSQLHLRCLRRLSYYCQHGPLRHPRSPAKNAAGFLPS